MDAIAFLLLMTAGYAVVYLLIVFSSAIVSLVMSFTSGWAAYTFVTLSSEPEVIVMAAALIWAALTQLGTASREWRRGKRQLGRSGLNLRRAFA